MPDLRIVLLASYLMIVNLLAFIICMTDRRRINSGAWRYPPSAVLVYSFMGGAAGALTGILLFRYKIRHKSILAATSGLLTIHLTILISLIIIHPFS